MQITPLERLKRLHQYSALMTAELAAMVEDLEASRPTPPEGEALPPSSAASSEGLDMAAIAAQIENQVKTTGEILEAEMDKIWGPKNTILKYLSPTVMEGGRGFIKASSTFQQYDVDIMRADAERLLTWPAGFYRNSETREDQLMIKLSEGDIKCVCYDALPSNSGQVRIVLLNEREQLLSLGLVDLTKEQFQHVETQLELAMKNLDLHHCTPAMLSGGIANA